MLPSSTSTLDSIERLLVVGPLAAVHRAGLHAGDLLVDRQLDGAVLADLRLDLQRQAHVLALDGLERIDRVAAGAGVGVLAGDKGHVLADDDLGLLVVQRQQIGRGQDIAVAAGLQKARQEAEHIDPVGALSQRQN